MRIAWIGPVTHETLAFFIETDQLATPGSQPQGARTILINKPDAICQAGRIIRNRPVVRKLARRRIQPADTALLTDPDPPLPVSEDRVNIVGYQAGGIIVLVPVMLKNASAPIESIQSPAPTTNPEITPRIVVNAANASAITQRILIARIGNVMSDLARVIDSIEGAGKQADPQDAAGIPTNRLDSAG